MFTCHLFRIFSSIICNHIWNIFCISAQSSLLLPLHRPQTPRNDQIDTPSRKVSSLTQFKYPALPHLKSTRKHVEIGGRDRWEEQYSPQNISTQNEPIRIGENHGRNSPWMTRFSPSLGRTTHANVDSIDYGNTPMSHGSSFSKQINDESNDISSDWKPQKYTTQSSKPSPSFTKARLIKLSNTHNVSDTVEDSRKSDRKESQARTKMSVRIPMTEFMNKQNTQKPRQTPITLMKQLRKNVDQQVGGTPTNNSEEFKENASPQQDSRQFGQRIPGTVGLPPMYYPMNYYPYPNPGMPLGLQPLPPACPPYGRVQGCSECSCNCQQGRSDMSYPPASTTNR